MQKRSGISASELTILKALWRRKAGTVRELVEAMESEGVTWAYTTVQTLLNRLETKGYVKRDTSEPAHTYRPATSRDKLLTQRLHELADQLCEGTATPLVMALVDSPRFTREDIAQFRRLLDELEQSAPDNEDESGGSSIAE